MKADIFYQRLHEAADKPPENRRKILVNLHAEVVNDYLGAVRAITPHMAARKSRDGRTLSQVVGHIAEWEHYTIEAAGELLAGVSWPRFMDMQGYVDKEGKQHRFSGVDDFNAYAAKKQASMAWETVREDAVYTATTLYTLFIHPNLLTPRLLESSRTWEWRMANGETLTISCAWAIWMIALEHAAVEHAADLFLGGEQATRPVRPGELN